MAQEDHGWATKMNKTELGPLHYTMTPGSRQDRTRFIFLLV